MTWNGELQPIDTVMVGDPLPDGSRDGGVINVPLLLRLMVPTLTAERAVEISHHVQLRMGDHGQYITIGEVRRVIREYAPDRV